MNLCKSRIVRQSESWTIDCDLVIETDAILHIRAPRLLAAEYLDKNPQVVWIRVIAVVDKGRFSRNSYVLLPILMIHFSQIMVVEISVDPGT